MKMHTVVLPEHSSKHVKYELHIFETLVKILL